MTQKEQIEKKIAELREKQKEIEKKERAKEREKEKKEKARNEKKIAKLVRHFHSLKGVKNDADIIRLYEEQIQKVLRDTNKK